jgi:hypothetical protein
LLPSSPPSASFLHYPAPSFLPFFNIPLLPFLHYSAPPHPFAFLPSASSSPPSPPKWLYPVVNCARSDPVRASSFVLSPTFVVSPPSHLSFRSFLLR